MALTKCTFCDNDVSDQATVCPICGTVLKTDEETRIKQPQPAEWTDVQEMPFPEEPSGRGGNKILVALLSVLLVVLIACAGWIYYSNVQEEKAVHAAQAQAQARRDSIAAIEQARQDSIAAAEKARQDSVRQVHGTIISGYLDKVHANKEDGGGYYLYDMNQDGLPELIVYKTGTYLSDYSLMIFSFLNGAVKKVYEYDFFNASLSQGHNGLLEVSVAQGTVGVEATKLTYSNGHVSRKTILSHKHMDDMDTDGLLCDECLKYMSLPAVNWESMSDEDPIRALFN